MTAPEGLILRRATIDDAPRLHELVAAAGRALAEQGFGNWLSPDATERFIEDMTTREVYLVIADRTETAVGVRLRTPANKIRSLTPNNLRSLTPNGGKGYEGGPIATFTIGATARRPYSPEPWFDSTAPALYLNRLAVDPSLQGGGIGGWCLEQIERLGRERGARAIRCDVLTANARFRRLYERLGYDARGERSHSGWRFTCYERVID